MISGPIGIFDSGLGGLTVLKTLTEKFPDQSFIYLGDVARLPYGNKSPQTIRQFGEQILNFLIERGCQLLVIACNTASTVFLTEKTFHHIPLFNVIHPGAKAALRVSPQGPIGIMATQTTVNSGAYGKSLEELNSAIQYHHTPCPLLVPLAEEGWIDTEVTQLVLKKYLKEFLEKKINTVILGCTHYPILRNDIQKVLGSSVHLVESGEVLAEELRPYLSVSKSAPSHHNFEILVTDKTSHFEKMATMIMGKEIKKLEKIAL